MKQCCANCKWLKKVRWDIPRCSFYDEPILKTIWWRKNEDAPYYSVCYPEKTGKTCKCWQEKK